MTIGFKTNGKSFRAAMESRAANLKIGGQRRIVLFTRTILDNLNANTPILTGKARAEWQAGLDEAPTVEVLGRVRPPTEIDYEAYAQAASARLDGFRSGQTIYIVNNAPYIAALNAGSSRQAAANFVEASIADATAVLKAKL